MDFSAALAYLRTLSILTMFLRMLLAGLCGAVIEYNRVRLQRPAGLRTHVLVCIGAASAVMVSQFLINEIGVAGDVMRIPAQVISGIGFLGAGSIIVTGKNHNHITGLTTAAGLWASACMGLAAGAGYYACAIMMCVAIYVVLVPLLKLDSAFIKTLHSQLLYIELDPSQRPREVMTELRSRGLLFLTIEAFGSRNETSVGYTVEVEVLDRSIPPARVQALIQEIQMVQFAQQIEE